MQDLNEICKAIAEELPWEVQSALLSIRDDGLRPDEIPNPMFNYMKELSLFEKTESGIKLSKLGRNLVDHCSC